MQEPKKTRTKKKKPGVISFLFRHMMLAGTAFILAAIIFLATMDKLVLPVYLQTGSEIEAPDFLGKPVTEAQSVARRNRLVVRVDSTGYHNKYPKDTIYLQIPMPGTVVKPGRNIRVYVSEGPRPIHVPAVVGTTLRNARFAIRDAGLTSRDPSWIPSNEWPHGIVARQVPEGGSDVPDDTEVMLYISNGRRVKNAIMPNLLDLSLSAARDSLTVRGFNVARIRVQTEEQPDLLPDTVIDQHPEPDRPASTDDEVVLIVTVPGNNEEEH